MCDPKYVLSCLASCGYYEAFTKEPKAIPSGMPRAADITCWHHGSLPYAARISFTSSSSKLTGCGSFGVGPFASAAAHCKGFGSLSCGCPRTDIWAMHPTAAWKGWYAVFSAVPDSCTIGNGYRDIASATVLASPLIYTNLQVIHGKFFHPPRLSL